MRCVATAAYLLLQIPAGAIVDRHDRRRLMILCDAVRQVAPLSRPVAGWTGSLTVAQLAVAGFVEGAGFVFFSLAEEAAVARNEARSGAGGAHRRDGLDALGRGEGRPVPPLAAAVPPVLHAAGRGQQPDLPGAVRAHRR
ncbi:MAG TPA: MFS transporter [Solirubrobacteraceae bacterium]